MASDVYGDCSILAQDQRRQGNNKFSETNDGECLTRETAFAEPGWMRNSDDFCREVGNVVGGVYAK